MALGQGWNNKRLDGAFEIGRKPLQRGFGTQGLQPGLNSPLEVQTVSTSVASLPEGDIVRDIELAYFGNGISGCRKVAVAV